MVAKHMVSGFSFFIYRKLLWRGFRQFSISISSIRDRCFSLFVTMIRPFSIAVTPINKSKSGINIPFLCNLTRSFAYLSKHSYIGSMVNSSSICSASLECFSKSSLFSAPYFSSAIVISDIKHFDSLTLSVECLY